MQNSQMRSRGNFENPLEKLSEHQTEPTIKQTRLVTQSHGISPFSQIHRRNASRTQQRSLSTRAGAATATGSIQDKTRFVLKKRKKEFIELVQSFQGRRFKGQDGRIDSVIPMSDFKACLQAFGLSLPASELKRFVVDQRPTGSQSRIGEQNRLYDSLVARGMRDPQNKINEADDEVTSQTPVDQTKVIIVNGYKKRVPIRSTRSVTSQQWRMSSVSSQGSARGVGQATHHAGNGSTRSGPASNPGGFSSLGHFGSVTNTRSGATGAATVQGVNVREFLNAYA